MGDRANVKLKYGEKANGIPYAPVYLYTHWCGSELAATVQRALNRKERWDDPSYLARIIFCEMVGSHFEGATGFGIAPRIDDNSHVLVEVDLDRQRVAIGPHSWSFGDYCLLDGAALTGLYLATPMAKDDG